MKKITRVFNYLSYINTYGHPDTILVTTLVRITQMGIMNRIMVKSPAMVRNGDFMTPATMYAATYVQSGGSKDKPVGDLRRITDFFERDFEKRFLEYQEEREQSLIKQADQQNMKDRDKKKFLEENKPRNLNTEISGGTTEGFIADREEFARAGFGGVFIRIPEFGDYITSDNPMRQQFLSTLVETYDHGKTSAISTKSNKNKININYVPTACYVYTSPAGLIKGKSAEKLKTFLDRGFARRSITCFPTWSREKIENKEERLKYERDLRKQAQDMEQEIINLFSSFYHWTQMNTIFTLTPEAEERLEYYKMDCYNKAIESEGAIVNEIEGRDWKAFKLSGLIAAFEHPDSGVVNLDDVNDAIDICEKYGKQFADFYNIKEISDSEELCNYFIQNKDAWISKGDIRGQNFVTKNEFKYWFEEVLPYVIERLDKQGYTMMYSTHGRSDTKYMVIPKEDLVERITINISQSKTNDETDTKFYKKELSFEDLKKVLSSPYGWSTTYYKNNYRKKENAMLSFRIFAYDIDEGMTLNEAKELLESQKIRAIIATTRNHRKDKHGVVADRFRIVIPLLYEWTPDNADQYRRGLRFMAEKIGLPIDRAATDASRFFYGNPEAQLTEIEGNPVDMSIYTERPDIRKTYTSDMQERTTPETDSGIQKWFVENAERYGGRNALLFQVAAFYIGKKGLSRPEAHEKVKEVNAQLPKPLPIAEIERTIFRTPALDNIQENI